MQLFRVLVNGENLVAGVDGKLERVGFYTNVVVEAFTPADAESRAIDAIREDARFQDFRLNLEDDPVRLSAEETEEIESLDAGSGKRLVFFLYPAEQE